MALANTGKASGGLRKFCYSFWKSMCCWWCSFWNEGVLCKVLDSMHLSGISSFCMLLVTWCHGYGVTLYHDKQQHLSWICLVCIFKWTKKCYRLDMQDIPACKTQASDVVKLSFRSNRCPWRCKLTTTHSSWYYIYIHALMYVYIISAPLVCR